MDKRPWHVTKEDKQMFNIPCYQGIANWYNEIPLHTIMLKNLEHWKHQILIKIWSKGNSHLLLEGMQNGSDKLEDSSVAYHKTKHSLTIQSNDHAPWLPKGVENVCPQKNLHTEVHGSFIHNCQNLEAATVSINRWMNKLTVVHPGNGVLLSTEKIMSYHAMKRQGRTLNACY